MKDTPFIYTVKIENLQKHLDYFISKGYDILRIKKMIYRNSNIMVMDINLLEEKRKCLSDLGYNIHEINKITGINPILYVLSLDNIQNTFNFLLSKGFSLKEVILITVKAPMVFNYSLESLNEKINILSKFSLKEDLVKRPSYLLQSVNLSVSRLRFFKENKIVLDHKAFNYLVLSNFEFIKKFGISNDDLKKKYL